PTPIPATPTPSFGPPLPEESSQLVSSILVSLPVSSSSQMIASSYQSQPEPTPEESTQFPIVETTEIEIATLFPATATTPIIILPTRTIEPASTTVAPSPANETTST